MKLYVVETWSKERYPKCSGCNWEAITLYILANSQADAAILPGLCSECICELIVDDGRDVTQCQRRIDCETIYDRYWE